MISDKRDQEIREQVHDLAEAFPIAKSWEELKRQCQAIVAQFPKSNEEELVAAHYATRYVNFDIWNE